MFGLTAYFKICRLYKFPRASDFRQKICYIVLRTRTYLLLHLFIKSCLSGTQGRILLFYFNYKPLFLLPNNTFYYITLPITFFILHGVVSYCYCIAYDSKACSIFDHISYIVIIEYLSVLYFY